MKSDLLKESLKKKLDITPSAHFDASFFEKLEKEKHPSGAFSGWIAWVVSGCAMASVLFIGVTNYHLPGERSFNHREYVESALEIQHTVNEDISKADIIDLTGSASDEI